MAKKKDWTVKEMDKVSKELFNRKASIAIRHRKCVSCQKKVYKADFKDEEAYQEYMECGLCQECEDECMIA